MVFKNFKKSNSTTNAHKRPVITSPLVPQRKKIQALYDYQSQGDMELSFRKGDEYYLINEADENWYNVTDLNQLKAGVVPISYFKILTPSYIRKRQSLITLHGKVLYDFEAMSNQELQVHKDEYVTICAHSGNDWYIAKPVSRLGGPGLVPVSYVGVLDISKAATTGELKVFDPQDILNSRLPTVEQWNKERDEYKKSATPISSNSVSNQNVYMPSAQMDQGSLNRSETLLSSKTTSSFLELGDVFVIRALITEKYFTKDNEGRGKYWYAIELTFNNGVKRFINRCYEDFFDFQAHLKKLFPRDASEETRILPTIPGPLANVSSTILEQRLNDLNNYLFELLDLPPRISHCKYVLSFFDIKYGNDKNILPDQIQHHHQQHHYPQQQQQQQQQQPSKVLDAYPSYQQYQLQQQRQPSQQSYNSHSQQQQHIPQRHSQPLQDTPVSSSQHSSSQGSPQKNDEKFKFYFQDDIFILKLAKTIGISELRSVLGKRCNLYNFQILLINDIDNEWEINTDDDLYRVFEMDPKRRKLRIVQLE